MQCMQVVSCLAEQSGACAYSANHTSPPHAPTCHPQDSRSAAAAAAAAIARGGAAYDGPSDIEAPLLGNRQAAPAAEANGCSPGLPGSPFDKDKSDTGSVRGGAQHAQRRDPKKLWALVRNSLGGLA